MQNNPPVCIYCNTQAGLIYNSNNGTCTCKKGYYLDESKTFQCYQCEVLYCDSCKPSDPSKCISCATGASLNKPKETCTCLNGFFVKGKNCDQCPYFCKNCSSPTAICISCVDSMHRDIKQNCKCINGYYDSGFAKCLKCSTTCLTCKDSTSCTSCNPTLHRFLQGEVCLCKDSYYEFYHSDMKRTCQKCSVECKTCITSPTLCTSCDL